MKSYRAWRENLNEATDQPVTQDTPADDVHPTENDKLFYKGQYSGVIGPLLSRLSGIILTDARFRRNSVRGMLLQDIILALGLNKDMAAFNTITNKIWAELIQAKDPESLQFHSPALRTAMDKKHINQDERSRFGNKPQQQSQVKPPTAEPPSQPV